MAARTGQIVPFVRKKSNKSRKESICDISITVDVMRACYRHHAKIIWLFSGDGDFLSLLFNEIVHNGKVAYAFLPLDKYLFEDEPSPVESPGLPFLLALPVPNA